MEDTIEEIMKGKVSIEEVLQGNKEKIQSLTSELEEIVRQGYFEIITHTEILMDLSGSHNDWPILHLPPPLQLPQKPQKVESILILDAIWSNINNSSFIQAGALIIANSSDPSIKRLIDYLLHPAFYSIFEMPDRAQERLQSIAMLYIRKEGEKDPRRFLVDFICKQLITKLKNCNEMDKYLMMASEFIDMVISGRFLQNLQVSDELAEIINNSCSIIPEGIVKENLSPYIEELTETLSRQIFSISDPSQLSSFISKSSPQYGLPNVWSLISSVWTNHASLLILSQCQLKIQMNLDQTLKLYNEKTKNIVQLIKDLPQTLDTFIQDLEKSIPQAIFEQTNGEIDCILVLGFIRHFPEATISECFNLDLSVEETKFLSLVINYLQGKSILVVCQEIKKVCGSRKLSLPELEVSISECRKGFGMIIGKSPNTDSLPFASLPNKLPQFEKLSLAPRFSPHLIFS